MLLLGYEHFYADVGEYFHFIFIYSHQTHTSGSCHVTLVSARVDLCGCHFLT